MKITSIVRIWLTFMSLAYILYGQESVRVRAVGDIMLGTYTPDGFLRPEEKSAEKLTHPFANLLANYRLKIFNQVCIRPAQQRH